MNIRGWVLGWVVLVGAGCPESVVHDERCSMEKGDETCKALIGSGFCSSAASGCPGEGSWYGCVFARPTDECYSPTGSEVTCASPNPPSECIEVAEENGETETTGLSEDPDLPEASTCGDGSVDDDEEECDDGNPINTDACTNACTIAVCGDSILQQGVEECEDGNMVDTDNCTSKCTFAVCGDEVVHEGVEQCDDDDMDNMDNTDDCVMCKFADCGDGFTRAGVEQCDDGNMVDTDGCTHECNFPKCGDNILKEDEECDDGNSQSNDGCSSDCEWEYRYVFVSSTKHNGNLGGLAGADAICNTLAAAAHLPGTYMAWISTEWGSPKTRFTTSTVPYIMADKIQVADDWPDLVDGDIDHSINKTEMGDALEDSDVEVCQTHKAVWTGTVSDGTAGDLNVVGHCKNFEAASGKGTPGRTNIDNNNLENNDDWTNCAEAGPSCSIALPIYCFQQ